MDRINLEILALKEIITDKVSLKEALQKYVSVSNREKYVEIYSKLNSILKYLYRIAYRVKLAYGDYKENEEVFLMLVVLYREMSKGITDEEFDDLLSYAYKLNSSFIKRSDENRLRESLIALRNNKDFLEGLKDNVKLTSVLSNIPLFLVKKYFNKYDVSECQKYFDGVNKKSKTYVLVNLKKTSADELVENDEQSYKKVGNQKHYLEYISKKAIKNTIDYKVGRVSPLSVGYIHLLDEIEYFYKENALYIDEEGKNDIGGLLYHRLEKVEGNLHAYYGSEKVGHKAIVNNDRINAKVKDVVGDKIDLLITYHPYKSFDLVVLNESSTEIGMIKRDKTKIVCLTKDEFKNYRKKELADLNEASKYVSLGGDLVYYFSSYLDEETKEIVERFLEENKDMELLTERVIYPSDESQSDCGYYAIMRRG